MEQKKIKKPDPFAPFAVKKTDDYGLMCGKLIESEWFDGKVLTDNNGCQYLNRREYIRNKRLFVRGENDLGYYKNFLSPGDDTSSWENLDWTSANWPEKYSRKVSNGISDDYYNVNIRSVDSRTAIEQGKKKDTLKTFMVGKDLMKSFKSELGIDLSPQIEIPEDDEGLELHMELREKPRIEIFEQLAIKSILDLNGWDYIEKQKNKDLTDIGIAVIRVWIDDNDGIKVDKIDPEYYIHSAVERNDFKDKYYEGCVETITLSDIKRESRYSDVQLREIAKNYIKVKGAYGTITYETASSCSLDDLLDLKIDVLRFAWKTSKTLKYKVKLKDGKPIKVQKRDESFEGETKERADFREREKVLDTWFEGNLVIGADYLYGYKECENVYDDVMNMAHSPYITMSYDIYENRLRSFLDNIEVPARMLQKTHLLIQRLIGQLRPDIVEIDLNLLAELDTGKGGAKKEKWQEALNLLNVKGIAFKQRVDLGEEGVKEGAAVTVHSAQQGNSLEKLLNSFAFYTNQIRELTGINPYSDGTMPNDALVGVSEMANLAQNTITRHIVDAAIELKKRTCEVISSRLHLIYKYKGGEDLRKLYNNIIGKVHVDAAEVMKNRSLSEFGFIVEMKPKQEEKKEFSDLLTLAIQEQSIDVEIVAEAKMIAESDIKLAIRYLLYERKKRMKERQESEMALARNKSENDAMAAQAKVQADTQAYQIKAQIDMEKYKAQKAIDLEYEESLLKLKQPFEQIKFQQDVYKEQVGNQLQSSKTQYLEDRKDARTEKQATQQSKLKEQAAKNGSAIDFEDKGLGILS
ncbi:hypothetical protein [Seonamhaeicola sp.]|uniref:hypothetical protein n=1 Tax=Seonamhaeicola sp. TaxID=1912245 RepID=UPI003567E58F